MPKRKGSKLTNSFYNSNGAYQPYQAYNPNYPTTSPFGSLSGSLTATQPPAPAGPPQNLSAFGQKAYSFGQNIGQGFENAIAGISDFMTPKSLQERVDQPQLPGALPTGQPQVPSGLVPYTGDSGLPTYGDPRDPKYYAGEDQYMQRFANPDFMSSFLESMNSFDRAKMNYQNAPEAADTGDGNPLADTPQEDTSGGDDDDGTGWRQVWKNGKLKWVLIRNRKNQEKKWEEERKRNEQQQRNEARGKNFQQSLNWRVSTG